ncbi:unnamed protein product [Schistosoma rodhaini]|uniref:Transmembrane protein 188 n=1 Tax=Schistosoma rodhaini TaxID=6188 RepID=A0AA85F739_9TREM|nr:unnamed protein product [Schistosoma rodhaini]CAH8488032.1 unnamed protein product [Schistosoma rodhaini]
MTIFTCLLLNRRSKSHQNINYNPNEPTEDLKAFERRLREIINGLGPKAFKWRIVLSVAVLILLCSSYCWLVDPITYQAGFIGSLQKHPEFVLSLLFLMALFFLGAHKKVVLPSIIAHRSRIVLAEYNMACDNSGKLILRPKPNL